MTILLLLGSPTTPSRSNQLLKFVEHRLKLLGYETAELQVKDLPHQALLLADFSNSEIINARELVNAADAVVVATPIYKAAYSGLLKTFLDLLPQDGLAGKIVLPIATAGSQSHMLALDYALRPVLASLSAQQILPSIFATSDQVQVQVQGLDGGQIDADILLRLQRGVEALTDALNVQDGRSTEEFFPVLQRSFGQQPRQLALDKV
jgi:FMN reductase